MVWSKINAYCCIIYLNPLTRIDEINEESWQFGITIHDESDGLTLCERFSQGYDYAHYYVSFKLLSFLFTISLICK
jgi:hypothetical protein